MHRLSNRITAYVCSSIAHCIGLTVFPRRGSAHFTYELIASATDFVSMKKYHQVQSLMHGHTIEHVAHSKVHVACSQIRKRRVENLQIDMNSCTVARSHHTAAHTMAREVWGWCTGRMRYMMAPTHTTPTAPLTARLLDIA